MTPDPAETSPPPPLLSAEDRATAFTTGLAPSDRAAALRSGRTPVPRRLVVWIAVGFAVLGGGGILLEHVFGDAGTAATSFPTTTLAGTGGPPVPVPPPVPPISASLDAFLGLKQLDRPAPPIALETPDGSDWRLSDALGKVVVVTFFDTGCTDICPVLGSEIRRAVTQLAPDAPNVEFAVVNTDPTRTAVDPAPAALTETGLDGLATVHFLTGPLSTLDTVWTDYGVTVNVGQNPLQQSHNDILYFVDPRGRLRAEAIPFADERPNGSYALSAADIDRFAAGIAQTAAHLAGSASSS